MVTLSSWFGKLKLAILMYHEVSPVAQRAKRTRTTSPIYSLSTSRFVEQMEYLAANGYQTITLDRILYNDVIDHQNRSVAISFDDGLENNFRNAFPVLTKFNLTATIFIATGFIGREGYLKWAQIKEMHNQGISIQSHTVSHRPLSILQKMEIRNELVKSKRTIEDSLGTKVEILSAPHGMINKSVIDIAKSVGYKAICTSEPGFTHKLDYPIVLKRVNISDKYDLPKYVKIIQSDSKILLPEIIAKKVKNMIKKVVGYNNYRRLYCLAYRIRLN